MAQLSGHPVGPPPCAPERERTSHLLLRAYAVLVVFSGLAYSWWYNLLGPIGVAALLGVLTAATLGIWIPRIARSRGDEAFSWRSLPWAALGYLTLALVSVTWSEWPSATATTWVVLVSFTVQGLFLASSLTWTELVRALESALRWIMGLSLIMEAAVALVLRRPLMPNFFPLDGEPDAHWYWVRGNLFDAVLIGPRIQGIVGNSNLLGFLCVIALIVFAASLRQAVLGRRAREAIAMHIAWIVLTAWLMLRAGSATAFVSGAVCVAILVIALVTRSQSTSLGRARAYAIFGAIVASCALTVALTYDRILTLLGRSEGLTGRDGIWEAVTARAVERPVFGHGFSSPWVPWHEAFDGWIVDHSITVFQAHNMWLDVFLQLGAVGVALIAIIFGGAVWRSWFFAVDRPRWDARSDHPYSPLSLLPLLVLWALLTQGMTESNPIMLWGWMLVTAFSFKLVASPVLAYPESAGPRRSRRRVFPSPARTDLP
ncbi:O-antigen ligase family protein [Microbacterium amylolyticum]|uniref:O-antigen ligase n=1 Tax=Microbacterium amylolyticum TaxID=936337 RepID=A0ABS4ZJV9_9MICO|nr:O-antigen ligase family protein [Microbacterium amylolyticum]MBP2437579.1 O-antigen ligase [Microbacterium amylolyticum]